MRLGRGLPGEAMDSRTQRLHHRVAVHPVARLARTCANSPKRCGQGASHKSPHVEFFCTEGGRGADSAFTNLEKLCQHPPEATLVVNAAHLSAVEHHVILSRLASSLSSARH